MEENKTVFFRGEVTYTQETLKEYQRASVFLDKNEIALHTIFLIVMLLVVLVLTGSDYTFYYALFLIIFVVLRRITICSNTTYNRIISQNEGVPLYQTYEFNDYHILVEQPLSGNRYRFHYKQVASIAQTKHFYVLYLKHRQYILLEKDKLTGGTEDDFIRFLCAACPDLKPKGLRSGTFGKVIYYTLIVLLCLAILSSMLQYLFFAYL